MLKIGISDIKSLYVGENKIKKAYVGYDLVYSESQSFLPDGYKQIEYIQGNGAYLPGIYDVPPINPNPSSVIYFQAQYSHPIKSISYTRYQVCGAGVYDAINVANTNYNYGVFIYPNNSIIDVLYGGEKSATGEKLYTRADQNYNERITVTLNGPSKVTTINGTDYNFTPGFLYLNSTLPSAIPFSPFGRIYWYVRYLSGDPVRSFSYYPPADDAKMYYFKWFSPEGEIMHDLIPCKNPSGTVGVYDIIKNNFITSANSSKFIAGPEV